MLNLANTVPVFSSRWLYVAIDTCINAASLVKRKQTLGDFSSSEVNFGYRMASITLYWPKMRIRVIHNFFECSDLLWTSYIINLIYCTHRKLNVHNGIANGQHMSRSWTLCGVRLYRDRQGRVYRDWSWEVDKLWRWIKSCVELKESSDFDADFNPDINYTPKL